jgi:Na+-transporting methylmalonyl-CoA/oxaloacetate decarboxylase gamma subunit
MDEVAVTILPHPVTTFILGVVFLGLIILWFEYRSMKNEVKKFNQSVENLTNKLEESKSEMASNLVEVSKKVDSRVDKAILNLKRTQKG